MHPDPEKTSSKVSRKRESADTPAVTGETFRALLENSSDAVVLFNTEWKALYVTKATERLLGYLPEEMSTISALTLVHPDDYSEVETLLRECLANPAKPVRIVARVRHKNGSWRIMEGFLTNFLDNPDVRGVVNNYRDITESVLAERALRESEDKFKRAFRSNPDAMSITTLAGGKFLDVNDAFVRLTGFAREELIGQVSLATSWVEPDHRTRMVRELTEHGHIDFMEVCFRKKTGEIFFANLSAEVVEIGGMKCILATSQDITERRRAAGEIRRSEEQFRSLVELAPYGIYRATRDGHFLMVNSALVKMLGYETAEEVLALKLETQVYEDPRERARILERARAGPSPPQETVWKRKDGSTISVRLAARLIYDHESLQQTEVFVENVTDQRVLERQLQTAQKMEAIGQLAGGVAHDFNNLMMIMRGRAELLLLDAAKPEQVMEQADEIIRASRQAATLTKQLLALSRHQVLEPVVLSLNTLVAELGSMLPHLIGKRIETTITHGPGLCLVKVDRGQFEQVVMNLAMNARDAMHKGGRLEIETSSVNLEDNLLPAPLTRPGRYVLLTVTDTGIGMDQETLSHIFEPFFTTKERGHGTGLGLAMVYGIVQQSGGHISASSTPGAGATFRIYLPEVSEPEHKARTESAVPVPGGTETILFVEDEESLRRMGADFLRSKGYDVLMAGNGVEALNVLRTSDRTIHLMVTDVAMPRMGGIELAEKATSLYPTLRTIFTSAFSGQSSPADVLEPGLPYLQKPFSMIDLAQQVRDALDGKPEDPRLGTSATSVDQTRQRQ